MTFTGGGTKGVTCVDGTDMSPAVYREMCKCVFKFKLDGSDVGE